MNKQLKQLRKNLLKQLSNSKSDSKNLKKLLSGEKLEQEELLALRRLINDSIKMLGLTSVFVLPLGSVLGVALIKVFKALKIDLLPSGFINENVGSEYTIKKSNDNKIKEIIDAEIFYEKDSKPYLGLFCGEEIIGGITYTDYMIDGDKIFDFDIAILPNHRGKNLSKDLILKMISDVRKDGYDEIRAEVINESLLNYLIDIGFERLDKFNYVSLIL